MTGLIKRAVAALATLAAATVATADEGMWLLNAPPRDVLRSKYKFEPSEEWVQRMQRSSVRFETGGSGSIVSGDGLVMTNHHVGSDMIQKLSTSEKNLLTDGFHARSRAEELKCPDLEVRVLWEVEDVTQRVQGAAPKDAAAAKAEEARRAEIAKIERESTEKTGLQSQVVTLYQGGKYHLYKSKKFTDVRLVFAPEEGIAFFGGDTDNFEFPRYCLDACFFRLYENGQPVKTPEHLAWSEAGAKEGELVFVFGHPGRTRRGYTYDHVRFMRDVELPHRLANIHRAEVKWKVFSQLSKEHSRQGRGEYFGIQNGRKVVTGLLAGLQDPAVTGVKQEREQALRERIEKDRVQSAAVGSAFDDIAEAKEKHAEFFKELSAWGQARGAGLLGKALTIVQLVAEDQKPDGERLPAYRQSQRESLLLNLYSPEPVEALYEVEAMTQAISYLADHFTVEHEAVARILDGMGPAARAKSALEGTKLGDPAARRALVEGGTAALEASSDPLIRIAKIVDAQWRPLNKRYEDEVEAVERAAYTKIAAARFATEGESVYPDATFTLRMAFGTVKGVARDGTPAFTEFSGLYKRATEREGEEGFDLPPSWINAKSKLNLSVPFNTISDADIIGGNSGSPLVNRAGEVVGLIFDGNVYSLVDDVAFDAENARAVSVDSRGIIEALTKVYGATELVKELTGR